MPPWCEVCKQWMDRDHRAHDSPLSYRYYIEYPNPIHNGRKPTARRKR